MMFLTALCNHIGVLSRDRVVSGGHGAEFPESPALDLEVIAGTHISKTDGKDGQTDRQKSELGT